MTTATAIPATAVAISPRAAECADGHADEHGDTAANARVRKGAKANEPKPFSGTGEQYLNLDNA